MYINGRNPVIEALRSGREVEKVFLLYGSEEEGLNRIRAEAKRAGVPCTTVDRRRFAELERHARLGKRSQGVIALVSPVPYVDAENLTAEIYRRGETPLLAVLDGVTDPHNIGAVIRSAECAGVHGLILGKRGAGAITDVVVKASAGAVEHLPLVRTAGLPDLIARLKASGLTVVGLDDAAEEPYTAYDFTEPTLIVIGSEGEGISRRIRSECDRLLSIPMSGKISSLNASVAAGVVFFEARRHRSIK